MTIQLQYRQFSVDDLDHMIASGILAEELVDVAYILNPLAK